MGIILDSSIVIASERRGDTVAELIERVIRSVGDQDAALSAISLTESFMAYTARKRPRPVNAERCS